MGDPISVKNPEWRRAVDEALARTGELVALVVYTSAGGGRDWFLVRDQAELEKVLAKVTTLGPIGRSHAVSLLATAAFPFRGRDVEALRAKAIDIASRSWAIVAAREEGDPELHDVLGADADEVADLEDWFRESHRGELLVGEDPYVADLGFWPEGDGFFAYGERPDGAVLPGA